MWPTSYCSWIQLSSQHSPMKMKHLWRPVFVSQTQVPSCFPFTRFGREKLISPLISPLTPLTSVDAGLCSDVDSTMNESNDTWTVWSWRSVPLRIGWRGGTEGLTLSQLYRWLGWCAMPLDIIVMLRFSGTTSGCPCGGLGLGLPLSTPDPAKKNMVIFLQISTIDIPYIYIYYPLYTNWPITNANLPHVIIQYILYFICQKLYWTVSGQLSNIGYIGQFQNEATGTLRTRYRRTKAMSMYLMKILSIFLHLRKILICFRIDWFL